MITPPFSHQISLDPFCCPQEFPGKLKKKRGKRKSKSETLAEERSSKRIKSTMEVDGEDPPKKPSSSSQLNLPPSMNRPTVSLETQRINRLIDSNHYHSPSKPIYSDRFIPSRSGSNFALFGLEPSPGKEDGPGSYAGMLRAAMFEPDTPEKGDVVTGFSPSRKMFRYKTETQRPVNSFSPLGGAGGDEAPGVSRSPVKPTRNILKSAYKVWALFSWMGFVFCWFLSLLILKCCLFEFIMCER